jgi:hypothetical protein
MDLDSVYYCTGTASIALEILRAQSNFNTSLQFDRRPMALPYPYGRRLEERDTLMRKSTSQSDSAEISWPCGATGTSCLLHA